MLVVIRCTPLKTHTPRQILSALARSVHRCLYLIVASVFTSANQTFLIENNYVYVLLVIATL